MVWIWGLILQVSPWWESSHGAWLWIHFWCRRTTCIVSCCFCCCVQPSSASWLAVIESCRLFHIMSSCSFAHPHLDSRPPPLGGLEVAGIFFPCFFGLAPPWQFFEVRIFCQGFLPQRWVVHSKYCCFQIYFMASSVVYGFFSKLSVLALRSRSLMKPLQVLLLCCVLRSWCIAIVLFTIFDTYERSLSIVWSYVSSCSASPLGCSCALRCDFLAVRVQSLDHPRFSEWCLCRL